jgi:predicted MPP superfamily phosphohydrolase
VDKLFASSALIAPAALIGAILFLLNGSILPALACVAITALAGLGIYARFFAPWQLQVKRLEIGDRKLQSLVSDPHSQNSSLKAQNSKLRVVFFSDLHLGEYKREEWAQRVVEAVNAQSPDVILIGGDFVGKTKCCDIAELLAPLGRLRSARGVFAVLGNHDYGIPGPDHSEELAHLLPKLNVRLLRNECVQLEDDLRLIGIDELWAHRDDFSKASSQCDAKTRRTLVLGHNPDLMMKLDKSNPVLDANRTFFIFGHTHHGQIYIPFLPGLAIPIKSKFYRGRYDTQHGALYVSAGCGENSTPTRLNTWPEIAVFEF